VIVKSREITAIFNRGLVAAKARGRIDVERVRLSAETMINWLPSVLGSMSIRPGLEKLGIALGEGRLKSFLYDEGDFSGLEFTPSVMRIWKMSDDNTLVTRAAVSSAVANGSFTTDLTSWTDADDTGTASIWATGSYLQLLGDGTNRAKQRQEVSVAGADEDVEHGIRIVVERGPLLVRIGTTAGGDDLFRQAVLRKGTHSLSVTPGGSSFWIEFSSSLTYPVLIASCAVEGAGVVEVTTPWDTVAKCKSLRTGRSGDVVFVSCSGQKQQRIERRPNNSWSVVDYDTVDGPFLVENTSGTTITPDVLKGEVTLTASEALFQSGHAGSLWRIESEGQVVSLAASGEKVWSDPIRVISVGDARIFTYALTGTWVGTVTIQKSVGDTGSWTDYTTYTSNATANIDDGLDNSEVYYRIGIDHDDYTSGTANLSLTYAAGSIMGSVRVLAVNSQTEATGVVVDNLGGTSPSSYWAEGAWSDAEGWPTAVAFFEGRLFWSGNGRNWASITDSFTSFDSNFEGDAGPIKRDVGPDAETTTNFLLGLKRLMAGTPNTEYAIRSTSLDEPITPTNYNSRVTSNKGSLNADAIHVDGRGYFISRNGKSLYELEWDQVGIDIKPNRVSVLVPEIAGVGGFTRIAYQTEPDVRIHCVRADGKVAILARDPAEDVICWFLFETDGFIEDVVTFPGDTDGRVVYRTRRVIDGATVYFLEEIVPESTCLGGSVSKLADCHTTGNNDPAATTISGLSYLEGEEVVLWADGQDLGTYTVASGAITASVAVSDYCVGLGYTADYKSLKMVDQTQLGVTLGQLSRISSIGFILDTTHYKGLKYGPSFTELDELPDIENGVETADHTIWGEYDGGMISFNGDTAVDTRICLRGQAPRPVSLIAAVIHLEHTDFD
jgi:hypothetical protein